MLRRMKDLRGFGLRARDGDLGRARDFIFDDKTWTVRYIVVDTSRWLSGRNILISPIVTDSADWDKKMLQVLLTRDQVKTGPEIRVDEERSANDEREYYEHYGWPFYWVGGGRWGPVTVPQELLAHPLEQGPKTKQANESNLRSMKQVTGYAIQATDGGIGQVDDFIIDDEPWVIRYMVVDTGRWWPGKKVIVSPRWISHVDWKNSNVYTNLSRRSIKTAPEFTPDKLDPNYEAELHKHYGHDHD